MFGQKNSGIALIQVLIISIVLTMLGIYINQTVRSQIGTVSLMKNAFELTLQLENAEAELLHALLSNKLYTKADSDIELVKQWNFYGKPFYLNENTQVTIQDLSSLLSLNVIHNGNATVLFELLGHTGHEVRTFLDSLADWKDKDDLKRLNGAEENYYRMSKQTGPRNAYLQSLSEVNYIKQGTLLTSHQWQQYFSTQIVANFNPLNAPDLLLKAVIKNDSAYQDVLKKRSDGTLSSYSFYQATGIEQDEYISFATSSFLKISIVVNRQNNKLSKQFIVDLRPKSSSKPVSISQITWNKV